MDDTQAMGVREGTGGEKEGRKNRAMPLLLLALLIGAAAGACLALGGGPGGDAANGGGEGLPPVATYSVDFDVDGGTPVEAQSVFEGGKAHEPSPPSKSGMDFAGWHRDSALSVPWNFGDSVTGDMTLYAKWESEAAYSGPTFRVSFATNGGSALPDATGVIPGSRIVAPPDPILAGQRLAGWYRDEGLTERWDFATDRVTCDTTLYALWGLRKYVVAYDYQGATGGADEAGFEVACGDPYSLATPSRVVGGVQYSFGGWFLMKGGVNRAIGADPSNGNHDPYPDGSGGEAWNIPRDVTLYAHWIGTPGIEYVSIAGGERGARSDGTNVGETNVAVQDYYMGEPVTAIMDDGFNDWSALEHISMPDATREIGSCAFYGLPYLKNISLPYGLEAIRDSAFKWCDIATGELTIPSSVTFIGDNAFYGCVGISGHLEIPSGVASIGDGAFQECFGIESLTIQQGVEYIGKNAFTDCRGITGALTIPSGVKSIGERAFSGCVGITGHLEIPSSVTSIGDGAFANCEGVESLTIQQGVESIGDDAFYYCIGITGALTIPSSVTSIGDGAFQDCPGITGQREIPSSVTSIGNGTFYGCIGITSLTIPSSVTSIGDGAFGKCGITSLTIPSSVTSIGSDAFYGCIGITSLTIPSSVTSIGNGAFQGCIGITNLTIQHGVESIGHWAFKGCVGISGHLEIPSSVTFIGWYAFEGCTSLSSVYIPTDSLTSFHMGSYALSQCSSDMIIYVDNPLNTHGFFISCIDDFLVKPISSRPQP
ncbi:MAG: leucine-rich repeat protein [Candidatus Methanoplasma sp.]|jgi:uncharacterized repeat protein (TIGR02543 family)|nr:leucine-rich repeat protein [Candidatus Methanoplasma sp.]